MTTQNVNTKKPQRTHTLPPTAPLSHQVGGHAGVHMTEDESLLLKPALPREIAFYQFVRDVSDPSTGLNALKLWIPTFYGLLSLEGKLAESTTADSVDSASGAGGVLPAIVPIPVSDANDGTVTIGAAPCSDMPTQTLVLQNLLYGYRKPCVLDVKLGTILYDEDASEEKKARMIKKAAESTSLYTGIRLTGFQVYSNHVPDPVVYGKAYGYGLKPEQLLDGIRNFFPCFQSTSEDAGLPVDILLTLLTSLHISLTDLRASLASAHMRIVGGSVLIIYEGDWERATAASGTGGGPSSVDDEEVGEDEIDEGDAGGSRIEVDVEVDEEGQMVVLPEPTSDSTSDETASSTDSRRPRLYTVSLIDFAHARVVPGEGPDQGILIGMDTLVRLVAQRKEEVVAFVEARRGR